MQHHRCLLACSLYFACCNTCLPRNSMCGNACTAQAVRLQEGQSLYSSSAKRPTCRLAVGARGELVQVVAKQQGGIVHHPAVNRAEWLCRRSRSLMTKQTLLVPDKYPHHMHRTRLCEHVDIPHQKVQVWAGPSCLGTTARGVSPPQAPDSDECAQCQHCRALNGSRQQSHHLCQQRALRVGLTPCMHLHMLVPQARVG